MDKPATDYAAIVAASGIPTTADAWRKTLQDEMEKQGSIINNDSRFSPFWRLIEGAVITCTQWLINKTLVEHVLPNAFLATATGDALKQKAWEVDITPKPASKAKGRVAFHRTQSKGQDLIIKKGTLVQTEAINGTIYRLVVLDDTTLPEGEQQIDVMVEAEQAGAAYNLGGGYYHVLPVAVDGIWYATNADDWIIEAGADEESDDDLRYRIRNQWSAVARWHIDAAYRAMLTEKAGINNDNVYFEHEAPRGAGTANAFILLDTGNPSAELIADLNRYITDDGMHGHGDDLRVFAMPETRHDVSLTVWPIRALTDDDRQALAKAVEDMVRAAFRENSDYQCTKVSPMARFSFSRLEGELHKQFASIESVRFDQDDIISKLAVPRLESLTVTIAS